MRVRSAVLIVAVTCLLFMLFASVAFAQDGSDAGQGGAIFLPLVGHDSSFVQQQAGEVSASAVLSLTGSNFEIDEDANLIVNNPAPALDWASVTEVRQPDKPSGSTDDSFGQGSKEDTPVPSVVDGSIPPNKSDLTDFGVYVETTAAGKFLNLYWTRVQEPSGTTNMDFELNKSSVLSSNGVTPVRTKGDLLVAYDLSQGGTHPVLSKYTWLDGTENPPKTCEASNRFPCWGDKTNLSAAGLAIGSINTTAITNANSDGLGALSVRTFGEASINLASLFDASACNSFGSAYLKSRSSDSFTAATKDFIAPAPINVANCGKITVIKNAIPDSGQPFTYTVINTDPVPNFSLVDDGIANSLTNTKVLNDLHTGTYTITEQVVPGWDATGLSCVDSSGGTTTKPDNRTAVVGLAVNDNVTCTYTNTQRAKVIINKVTVPAGNTTSFAYTSTLPGGNFSLTGASPNNTRTESNILPGSYSVTEAVPAGWDLTNLVCTEAAGGDNGSSGDKNTRVASIDADPGETITCTFTNTKRATVIVKKVMIGGTGTFNFTGTPNGSISTNNGTITAANVVPGNYSSSESAAAGWSLQSITCDDSDSTGNVNTRTASFVAAAGETVTCTFTNRVLYRVIVLVCRESDDTLSAADVTFNGSAAKGSLASPPSGLTNAQLCALTGARFDDVEPSNTAYPATVKIPVPQ